MHNPFSGMKKREWALWIVSLIVVAVTSLTVPDVRPTTFLGTLVGVTALIFMARGDVWGQILSAAFGVLYAITSWELRYWSEVITYLGMSLPMSLMAIVSWLRNPFEDTQEVTIARLKPWQRVLGAVLSAAVTAVFYFVLKAFDTPNLAVSTLSITTSFFAAYLTYMRSAWYAMAYGANDVVLIVLWILATVEDAAYAPMIACFGMFLINDLYAWVSWRRREKRQRAEIGGASHCDTGGA